VTERAVSAVPIRYMGTKRDIAHRVRRLVADLKPRGPVVDLFSGMGCVAEGLAGLRSVVTNDALSFTAVFARARFTASGRPLRFADAITMLREPYRAHLNNLVAGQRSRLRAEERALGSTRLELAAYMADAEHVANSTRVAKHAKRAASAIGADRYCMTTHYFSAGYFGLRQAMQLDALRFAIDSVEVCADDRDWLLGSWLAAAATVANAPGHTAQYLKPNNDNAAARIRRYWRRSIWEEFQNRLIELKLVGTPAWRAKNRVEVSDALELLRSGRLEGVGAVYADPPYTKDQYSRYYHVYETLYRYDFPGAAGEGRARPDRFSTGFCLISGVEAAFVELFEAVADLKVPLVLSYPSAGLLRDAGRDVSTLARTRLRIEAAESFSAEHSTLGASKGAKTKSATENLYVCRPA
jgi:adenine-specific DNA-methyltransferase